MESNKKQLKDLLSEVANSSSFGIATTEALLGTLILEVRALRASLEKREAIVEKPAPVH